jgi:predicted ABC-class ATPase
MALKDNPIPFVSPPELKDIMDLSEGRKIEGMGIPRGVTLVVGGGFHRKSTLLNAREKGIYNHIPGDGREYVVTHHSAVKIRAEDGRAVQKVTIEPFISNLPLQKDTKRFSTPNASGSTSQAANIIEAVEVGCKLLLIDEDTSATNFMIRDERMQELVSKDKEPITPFIDKVQKLYSDFGVSTILVMGGSGDYFDVADTVIMKDTYQPLFVTQKAKIIADKHTMKRRDEGGETFGEIVQRKIFSESFDASRGRREVKIEAKGLKTILYGENTIDLSYVEQLVDSSQTRCIGYIIHYLSEKYFRTDMKLKEALEFAFHDIEKKGVDILLPYKAGNLAMPRIFEVAAAINRMRTLKIK